MKLSLVVPVWNDQENLDRLIRDALNLGLFHEIVVSDDGSDPPCRPGALENAEARGRRCEVIYLRGEAQRGAGHARNAALAKVTGDHVLFFDSDDLLRPALGTLVRKLAGERFDFCMFKHADTRTLAETGRDEPMPGDAALWRSLEFEGRLIELTPDQAATLATTATYPWNKIYRTGFLRDENVRCTEIRFHNDVELHWTGFVRARRILAADVVGCEHVVADDGDRLTNRTSELRLEAFKALETVFDDIGRDAGRAHFRRPFTVFCIQLFRFIYDNVGEENRARTLRMIAEFMPPRLDEAEFALFASRHPSVAQELNVFLREHAGW